MAFRVLPHTADTGVEATADSLGALVAELATGMFSLVATPDPTTATVEIECTVSAPSAEDLVVDTLSEVLWRAEAADVVPARFEVTIDGLTASVSARATPVRDVDALGPPIKAVTYHRLAVEPRDDGWYGRIYLDV